MWAISVKGDSGFDISCLSLVIQSVCPIWHYFCKRDCGEDDLWVVMHTNRWV